METLDAAEFLSRLAASAPAKPAPLDLVGLAKPDDSDPANIALSVSADCKRWHAIPAGMVEGVQTLQTVSCRDHTHPLVRLFLRRPAKEDVSAGVLYDLLLEMRQRQQRSAAAKAMAATTRSAVRTNTSQPSPSRAECFIYDDAEGYWVCCPREGSSGSWDCTGIV